MYVLYKEGKEIGRFETGDELQKFYNKLSLLDMIKCYWRFEE